MSTPKDFLEAFVATSKRFERASLNWIARGFGWEDAGVSKSELKEWVEEAIAAKPKTVRQLLDSQSDVLPKYALAAIAHQAGLAVDIKKNGFCQALAATVGNAVVNGPLVVSSEDEVILSGDLTADALVTAADCLIGGKVVAHQYVVGVNDSSQSLWAQGGVRTPLFVTLDYMAVTGTRWSVGRRVKFEKDLYDEQDTKELRTLFTPAAFAEGEAAGWEPDGVVELWGKRAKKGKPLFQASALRRG